MLPRDAAPPVVQRLAYRPPSHLIDEVCDREFRGRELDLVTCTAHVTQDLVDHVE
jgi:hypothetical protein